MEKVKVRDETTKSKETEGEINKSMKSSGFEAFICSKKITSRN
jgi:hypothetical protein